MVRKQPADQRRLGITRGRKKRARAARPVKQARVKVPARRKQPAHERAAGISHGRKKSTTSRDPVVTDEDWRFHEHAGTFSKINTNTSWLRRAVSPTLAGLGVDGDGLFAARDFRKNQTIGRYIGKIMSRAEGSALSDQPGAQFDSILDLELNGQPYSVDGRQPLQTNAQQQQLFGEILIDHDQFSPGMHAELINDAKGTQNKKNCLYSDGGFIKVTCAVRAGQELLTRYGKTYW